MSRVVTIYGREYKGKDALRRDEDEAAEDLDGEDGMAMRLRERSSRDGRIGVERYGELISFLTRINQM